MNISKVKKEYYEEVMPSHGEPYADWWVKHCDAVWKLIEHSLLTQQKDIIKKIKKIYKEGCFEIPRDLLDDIINQIKEGK